MEEFFKWLINDLPKTAIFGFVCALGGGLLGYIFKFLPEFRIKQRQEWREIVDRLKKYEDEFLILINLNSTQRENLTRSFIEKRETDVICNQYCAIRESLSDIITKLNDICSELSMSPRSIKRQYVEKKLLPFIDKMTGEKGILRIVRKLEQGLGKDSLIWEKRDLVPCRMVLIRNAGILNLGFIRYFRAFRKFYTC